MTVQKNAAGDIDLKTCNVEELAVAMACYQAQANAFEIAAIVADDIERQQDNDHGAANTGGAAAVAVLLRKLRESSLALVAQAKAEGESR